MKVLLDTHLVLWAILKSGRLPRAARETIERDSIFVSAASIWEVSVKTASGKLGVPAAEILAQVEPTGFALLPVTGVHAARVATLPRIHKDPFDHMLIAQAQCEAMVLLTVDGVLGQYGEPVRVI